MGVFYQAAAAVLLASILGLVLKQEFSLILSILVCCGILVLAVTFLQPVIDFLQELEALGAMDSELIKILLKVAGICLISEISGLICSDAGKGSLAKAMQILATALILWLSIPVFQTLLELIQTILGGL